MFTTTFYSFKGGVGRTLSLMNVAYELVSRGNKVAVIDFDLEAPGMQTFSIFKGAFAQDNTLKINGVVDYINNYLLSLKAKPEIPKITEYLYQVPDSKFKKLGEGVGELWFMPASKLLTKESVQNINWFDLYDKHDGYLLFEELKLQISEFTKADYLLIDSRTGLTDHSSICTKQLPDLLSIIFFPNDQNIVGLQDIVKNTEKSSIFVASRLPSGDDEFGVIEKQLKLAKKMLKYDDTSSFSNFTKLTHNSNVELVKQDLLVEKKSKNIQLKNDYLKLVDLILFNNKDSLPGNMLFLRNVQMFVIQSTHFSFSQTKTSNISKLNAQIKKEIPLIENRIKHIVKNYIMFKNISSELNNVIRSFRFVDESLILNQSKFLNYLLENNQYCFLFSALCSYGQKSSKIEIKNAVYLISMFRNFAKKHDCRDLFSMSFLDLYKLSFPNLKPEFDTELIFLNYNSIESTLKNVIKVIIDDFFDRQVLASSFDRDYRINFLTSIFLLSLFDLEEANKSINKNLHLF